MQRYTVYLYLETALHVSGGISTHHQEHTQLYLQHLVPVKPLLLPTAIKYTECLTGYRTRHFFNNSNPVWTQMVATSSTCYDVVTFLTQ